MNEERVLETVVRTIRTYLEDDHADITGETSLEAVLGIDSTEMALITVDVEKEFGVSLKGVKFSTLKTPNHLVAAILERLPAAARA